MYINYLDLASCCVVYIVYTSLHGYVQVLWCPGPNGPLLTLRLSVIFTLYHLNKIVPMAGTHGPFNPFIMGFYYVTCPLDCFYANNTNLVSISSSPVPMYHITCTCIFYAFLGALCSALFWRKPTQGSFWCLNIHLVSCICWNWIGVSCFLFWDWLILVSACSGSYRHLGGAIWRHGRCDQIVLETSVTGWTGVALGHGPHVSCQWELWH